MENEEEKKQAESSPDWRAALQKKYPDLKIIDVTAEWEGKTTIFLNLRFPKKTQDDK
ncbi:MAG: hypothetical protein NTW82_11180 [Bacteroidia bacterium]|nr:hypothetical protein [Bacteroidia bacterium]